MTTRQLNCNALQIYGVYGDLERTQTTITQRISTLHKVRDAISLGISYAPKRSLESVDKELQAYNEVQQLVAQALKTLNATIPHAPKNKTTQPASRVFMDGDTDHVPDTPPEY